MFLVVDKHAPSSMLEHQERGGWPRGVKKGQGLTARPGYVTFWGYALGSIVHTRW